ncbi:MAG: isoaspartyl peptidase/L-asparaginase [Candidatus Acidiferrales bacterium]
MKPSLIVHGGAWNIPDESVEACRAGCRKALEAGWEILARGGTALDAVEAAIVVLEDDPIFDAGIGSHLNRDGRVELDAILMDGATLQAGAVAAVERVRNPIRLARKLLESREHMMLVGAGAEQFAVEHGLALCRPEELVIERERSAWSRCIGAAGHQSQFHVGHELGTVGAVALDRQGGLIAGTSTGGTCCKHPGRVGDSPLIGCGCYADVEAGGVSCTGWGEAIMKIVMAKTAADLLRGPAVGALLAAPLSPQAAAEACVRLLADRVGGRGGLILLDRNGRPGFAFNTPRMAYGYLAADGSVVVSV